jgi:hypothetical protein
MMNAATPEGTLPRRMSDYFFKKLPVRRASQEALKREFIVKIRFSLFWCELRFHAGFYRA